MGGLGSIKRWLSNIARGLVLVFESPTEKYEASIETEAPPIELIDAIVDIEPENKENISSPSLDSTTQDLPILQVTRGLSELVFTKNNLPRIGVSAALTTLNIAINFLSPYLLGETIRLLSSDDENQTSQVAGFELSRLQLITALIATYTLTQILPNIRDQIMTPVSNQNNIKLLEKIIQHTLDKSLNYHVNTPSAKQIDLIGRGFSASSVATPLLTSIGPILFETTLACTALSRQYGIEVGLGLLALMASFTAFSANRAKSIILAQEEVVKESQEAWKKLTVPIGRYKIIRDFGKLKSVMEELHLTLDKYKKASVKATNSSMNVSLGQIGITRLGMLLAALHIGSKIQSRQYSVQEFVVLIGYLNQLSGSLPAFGESINQLFSAYPNLKYIFSELSKSAEVVDLHPDSPLLLVPGEAPSIEFENVSFSFPKKPDDKGESKPTQIFKQLSFKILPGQTVAFVSSSGAGKTTIFNLLYGYYSPDEGVIKINGQDISQISLLSLQDNIALVGQKPNLFIGTIRENIAFGAPISSEVTDDDILEKAKKVNLDKFIESFPKKLDTNVGEGDGTISGGQQQKIAILRALFKQGSIKLLDEITASLDTESATDVLKSLIAPSSTQTTLMITHKLTEARLADQIIVLDQGKVMAQGTHEELLATCPLYQKLWAATHMEQSADQHLKSDENPSSATSRILNVLNKERKSIEKESTRIATLDSSVRKEVQPISSDAWDEVELQGLSL